VTHDRKAAVDRAIGGRARRARRQTSIGESGDVVIQVTPQASSCTEAQADGVVNALVGLPAEEQEVVDLRFLRGMEVGEIAVTLGISEWMVRRRLQVAVSRLRVESLTR